ncbi:MAG: beta-L-arabinofuranosidase domain-containing protein [Bryobacteraceae bacterium]
MKLTRREFVATTVVAPWAAAAAPASVRVRAFDLKQVRLLESPFREAQERNREFLHSLEADRLLHTFRLNAGLPSSAQPLGGWERPDVELRGHFTGHYLSACALMYAATGDDELRTRGNGIVEELAKCQKANGDGYLSAFPREFFDRLKAGQNVWAPWYTIHKILAGLLEMYTRCGNEQALAVLEGMAGWTGNWVVGLSGEQMARVLQVEFGGMNEVLYNLSAATGKAQYAATAHRFDHQRLFDPLAEGRDELTGLHMNTQIPKIVGAARRYELTGEERYRRIAEFFWKQVSGPRAYCTGGGSNHEHWRTAPGKLAGELSAETQECCCTYNMLRLTRHLFSWEPLARYADYYERALFNGVLGAMNPKDGMTMYFVPLASGYWKMFSTPRHSFWCCTGTGVESFSKLADSIYFHDEAGLYVNLFIASELEWPEKGLQMRQETRFPEEQGTTLRIQARRPVALELSLRVPWWARRGIAVKVNGRPLPDGASAGGYVNLHRTWKSGDKVEVSTPMSLYSEAMPDDPTLKAFLYGPLVLAGELGTEGLTEEMQYGGADGSNTLKGNPVAAPGFRSRAEDPAAWIQPVAGRDLAFRTSAQERDVTLAPLDRLFGQRYGVYWRVKPAG